MRRAEEERLLRGAGFTCTPKRRHDLWRHPSGVVYLTCRGASNSNPRHEAELRVALRRAARLTPEPSAPQEDHVKTEIPSHIPSHPAPSADAPPLNSRELEAVLRRALAPVIAAYPPPTPGAGKDAARRTSAEVRDLMVLALLETPEYRGKTEDQLRAVVSSWVRVHAPAYRLYQRGASNVRPMPGLPPPNPVPPQGGAADVRLPRPLTGPRSCQVSDVNPQARATLIVTTRAGKRVTIEISDADAASYITNALGL